MTSRAAGTHRQDTAGPSAGGAPPRRRARIWLPVASAAVALALTGCGAGPGSATTGSLPSVPGVNASEGQLAVRNAAIVFAVDGYQPGDTVPVEFTVANDYPDPVSLLQASSEAAASVTVAEETPVAEEADDPARGPGEVPGFGIATVRLELTGLRTGLNAADAVPLELVFDNGASFSLQVPVAPPLEREGTREPVLDEAH